MQEKNRSEVARLIRDIEMHQRIRGAPPLYAVNKKRSSMRNEPDKTLEEGATAAISPNDLEVIRHVLAWYTKFVRFVVPASKERGVRLALTEHLRQRITNYASSGKEMEPFPLTFGELSIIDSALKNFVANLAHMFPQSQERDETIGACESLRSYISSSFALVRKEGGG